MLRPGILVAAEEQKRSRHPCSTKPASWQSVGGCFAAPVAVMEGRSRQTGPTFSLSYAINVNVHLSIIKLAPSTARTGQGHLRA